jgi:hypothetical protein
MCIGGKGILLNETAGGSNELVLPDKDTLNEMFGYVFNKITGRWPVDNDIEKAFYVFNLIK